MNPSNPLHASPNVLNATTGPCPCCAWKRPGPVLHLRLNRPAKRNSVSDELLAQVHTVFVNLPEGHPRRSSSAAKASTSAPGWT